LKWSIPVPIMFAVRALGFREIRQLPGVGPPGGIHPGPGQGHQTGAGAGPRVLPPGNQPPFVQDCCLDPLRFEKVQSLESDDVVATLLTGMILIESGKVADGIKELKTVESQFPDDPWPSYFLYCSYKKANQRDLAAAAFARFQERDGNEQEVKNFLRDAGFSCKASRVESVCFKRSPK
jgi:hypothetical protein